MKAILQQPYQALSGRNGALVNYMLQNNSVVRSFVTPQNPQSAVQTSLRGYFTNGSQAFNLLTDQERASWKSVSDLLTRTNSLGQQYVISDKGLYVAVNQYRQMDGQAITDTAPSLSSGAAPSAIAGLNAGTTDVTFNVTHAQTGGFWLVEISDTLPGLQRQARDNEIFLASTVIEDNIIAVSSSVQTITITKANMKFAIAGAQRRAVRVTRLTAGYIKGASLTTYLTSSAV